MELIFLKKLIDVLVTWLASLVKKKNLEEDAKKAADLVSEAIKELLTVSPNLNRVKAKLSKAEQLCPGDSEDLLRAKEMLLTIQQAAKEVSSVASASRATVRKRAAKRRTAAKKKPAKKKPAVKKRAAKKKTVKKKAAKKKPVKKT